MKDKKIYVLIFSVLLLIIVYNVHHHSKIIHNSSTVQFIILDKIQKAGEFLIQVMTSDGFKRDGNLILQDKEIWSGLKINMEYFAVVQWDSYDALSELFSYKTYVNQIELMQ